MKSKKTILLLVTVILLSFFAFTYFKDNTKKVSKKSVETHTKSIANQKDKEEDSGYLGRRQTYNKVEGLNGQTVKRDDALHRKENKIIGLEGLKVGEQ